MFPRAPRARGFPSLSQTPRGHPSVRVSHPSARRLGSVSEVLKEDKPEPAEGTSGVEVLQAETRTWLVLKSPKVLFLQQFKVKEMNVQENPDRL